MSIMQTYLDEIVPALQAAGMTVPDIEAMLHRASKRVPGGGSIRTYLEAITLEVVMLDDPLAQKAFFLAIEQAVKLINGKADA